MMQSRGLDPHKQAIFFGMSYEPTDNTAPRPAPTDSPWFWLMLFSAAGLIVLVIVWPKYSARQGRLELQFRATQEATRRKVEGTPVAREPGEEGDAAPPAAGELIVKLWPISLALAALLIGSSTMYWRSHRARVFGSDVPAPGPNSPEGSP